MKSYLDYGAFTPMQVAATAALNGPDDCVKEMRAIYKKRRDVMVESFAQAGWPIPAPRASMFAWAPVPERFRASRALEFSKLLIEKADVAVAPGVGFGEHGEGYRASRAGRERAAHPPGGAQSAPLLRDGRCSSCTMSCRSRRADNGLPLTNGRVMGKAATTLPARPNG